MYSSKDSEISHNQVSDKALEEQSKAFERHLLLHVKIRRRIAQNLKRTDGWRFIMAEDTGKDVTEWEEIWEGPDGYVYFFEAKYLIDGVSS